MREPAARTIHLQDYTPPAFLVDTVALEFDIDDDHTTVRARLAMRRNPQAGTPDAPLVLDGDALELLSVAVDATALAPDAYMVGQESLTIPRVPDRFSLTTTVRIRPQQNTRLEGLYASSTGLFTQCEAEGFRGITWFPDRPDIMARYTVTVRADRDRYPVLLSNGNLVDRGLDRGGRHWVRWEDPFPKPSYLFALVAARLDCLADSYVTSSGRRVALAIYVEPGKLDQCDHAMLALKKSMLWDERVFGLEVDVDCYMIVAVGDFNMGAMENKGLNIFNTKYVLARADTATDTDFDNIDRVVAHEYFHNWTGNRVTCRDWFQLSLKEGLTVFRDQEFGADHHSRSVTRIAEVRTLRAAQFPEDAGPMAHPIRPQSYQEISNFYTATVYEKGAEVVRMIHTLLGRERFRQGMDLYFARHDGQAVTTDDFVQAMQDASGVDLARFRRWYDQSGTPVIDVRGEYDAGARTYALTLTQSTPPTPDQPQKQPLHIPFAVGLVGADGRDVPLRLAGESGTGGATRILSLLEPTETRVFLDVPPGAVPSLNRNFSAPVKVRHDWSNDALTHLMAHDSDPFNRWEAGQSLAQNLLLAGIAAHQSGKPVEVPDSFVAAMGRVLADGPVDPAFAAQALWLPGEGMLFEQMDVADPGAIHAVRMEVMRRLASALRPHFEATYRAMHTDGPYSPDARSAGRRALRNACLGYLMLIADAPLLALCVEQFERADNMTDAIAALTQLANTDCAARVPALARFHDRWRDEALVIDKWLVTQATSRLPGTLVEVERLLVHPSFDIRNPNKVRSLIGGFCNGNPAQFHAADGSGYRFMAERVRELDPMNPQIAARLARSFDRWRKVDAVRQAHARAALESIAAVEGLSRDTAEVVAKSLK